MSRRVALPVVLLVLATSVAHADADAPAQAQIEEKSPGTAVLLSLGTTALGVGLVANADGKGMGFLGLGMLMFGPSTGRWYAGETGLGTLALRGVGGAMFVYGFASVLESECDYEDETCGDDSNAGALMLAGAGIWLGTSIADIIFAKQDADRWNERRRNLTLAPTLIQGPPGGASTTGLVLRGSW